MSEELTPTAELTMPPAAPQSIGDLKRKAQLTGTVKRVELYGAFVDLGLGTDGILHISQIGQDRVNRVSDVLQVGQTVDVWVDRVNPSQGQIILTMVEPLGVEWSDLEEGQVYTGKVIRLENFGAFIDIGAEKEGLVHISELSHDYVKHPSEAVRVGDEVNVKVLNFSKRKRRINLSVKAMLEKPVQEPSAGRNARVVEPEDTYEEIEEPEEEALTAMEMAFRMAMGDNYQSGKGKKGQKKANYRQKIRSQQEDILSRTLRHN
ncbi:MAG: S1 RNA-binding domain-containing protein [Anaerolineae bacterium]|nr:S1 RNA-binding domain-containing protein [Anaerolineae bacterium]